MILFYRLCSNLLYPFLALLIYFRKFFKKEDPIRYKEKIFSSKFNVKRKENSILFWFHAASIGEIKSILPVIKELNKKKDNLEFLITTVTLSSSQIAEIELKNIENAKHRFFPIDSHFLIKKFLSLWKPFAIFLVDSEIWPNLITQAKRENIFLALINARISKKSFLKWKMISRVSKELFSNFDFCLTSNLDTSNFLKQLNAKNIIHTGNLKLVSNGNRNEIKNFNLDFLKKKNFWFAASTHDNEEKFCLNAHLLIKENFRNILTIIAPRHINRVDKIKRLCEEMNLKFQILDKEDLILESSEIVVINSFGNTYEYFKFAKSVFIGKSVVKKLKGEGGQNPVDAARLGCKVYHGPYVYNFKEIYEILKKLGISHEINSPEELSSKIINDFKNSSTVKELFVKEIDILGKETLEKNMKNINKFLFNENH